MKTKTHPDNYTLKHTLLSLFPPYLLALIFFPVVVGMYFNLRLVEVEEPFITLSFVIILIFLRYFTGKNIFYYIAAILVFIDGFVLLSHWIMLKGPLTSNSMYVVFNTNLEEAAGFLHLKSGYEFLLIIPYLLIFMLSLTRTFNYKRILGRKSLLIAGGVVLGIIFFLGVRFYQGGFRYGTPVLARSSILYYKDLQGYKKLKHERQRRSEKVEAALIRPDKPQVVVLIEGESLNRNHMSLYGYYRDTNPLLKKADDIIIYKDVVSGYASTAKSIYGSLTEANIDNQRESYECFNIIDICRAARVKTYWLSNQSPLGTYDNIVTLLAEQSDKQEFLNRTTGLTLSKKEEPSYDSVLFEALTRALQDDGDQKFIILHLLGSHGHYSWRYPSEFNRYNGNTKKDQIIAEYDNSVLHNDFVIDSLLSIMRDYSEKSNISMAAIYTSDHAQNLYEEADYAGHSYTDTIYNSIVEIPYLVWLSPQYEAEFPEKSQRIHSRQNDPYMTDDHFHSLIDIMNINTPVLEGERSLFNPNYNKDRKRVLFDGREYIPHRDKISNRAPH